MKHALYSFTLWYILTTLEQPFDELARHVYRACKLKLNKMFVPQVWSLWLEINVRH